MGVITGRGVFRCKRCGAFPEVHNPPSGLCFDCWVGALVESIDLGIPPEEPETEPRDH